MKAPNLKYLRGYPVLHKEGRKERERYHWQLDTHDGFHYGGDDSGDGRQDGWATRAAAERAGRAVMKKHFRRTVGKRGEHE